MRTKLHFIIIAFCCAVTMLLSTSCKQEECPAFPEHLIDYYPYKVGDTLKFANQNKDTISYYIGEFNISPKHTSTRYGICGSPELNFRASQKHFIGNISIGRINMEIGPSYGIHALADANKDPFNPKDSLLFGKTVILEPAPHNKKNIDYVKVIKGEGIVEFFDNETNYLWKKIN
jgi:hypothetical protein